MNRENTTKDKILSELFALDLSKEVILAITEILTA